MVLDLRFSLACNFSSQNESVAVWFYRGLPKKRIRDEDPINELAVRVLGELHDALKQDGYSGEKLEVFLVRLVFCFFADDTGIFTPKTPFST